MRVMESFHVTPLYTSSSNDSTTQAFLELAAEHENKINVHGLSIEQQMTCAQTRLLALRQRLIPNFVSVL